MKYGFALMLYSLIFLSPSAGAVVLNYDETVDGDLIGQTLLVDAGSNTVSGTWRLHPFDDTITDPDDYFFTVPTGHVVTGISLSGVTDILITPPQFLPREIFNLNTAGGTLLGQTGRTVANAPYSASLFPGLYPLPADTYVLFQAWDYILVLGGGTPRDFDKDDLAQVSYTWTIDVEAVPAVPIPAAIWLFGTALLGIAGLRTRRKVI